ncbi:MAG: UDP-N-acetylglucosamine 2-epimerase (non-hydrolyzing) [Chloroflexi bacterium]|nr:MAG: UDP-N-acetylglucosamine 2-epimerase (non-hydrolyzing) [Chloroflexota bacterium]
MSVVLSVVGARPNFMKLAPVARALSKRRRVRHVIVHTGQHYDPEMSSTFFRELQIAEPDHNLQVGSGSHARQTAAIMERLERLCTKARPDVVLAYGDVNSTAAAALVAAKLGISVGHIEAGLRSRDRSMPEEINRLITDRLSDILFTPSRDASENLRAEGIPAERIQFVGNVMIDSVVHALPAARELDAPKRHALPLGKYVVVTLHRPSNVDEPRTLAVLLDALAEVATDRPVIFPMHPRTRARIASVKVPACSGLRLLEPIAYTEMLSLVASAGLVITDSGGLQEETSYLGIPCITVRANTERPITCTQGTNRLVAPRRDDLLTAVRGVAMTGVNPRPTIERWDGETAERIAGVLCDRERFE